MSDATSIKYMDSNQQTQNNIVISSLQIELNNFDYNINSQLQQQQPFSNGCDNGAYVELEGDHLNDHPCMAPMISLINHMVQNRIGELNYVINHLFFILFFESHEMK